MGPSHLGGKGSPEGATMWIQLPSEGVGSRGWGQMAEMGPSGLGGGPHRSPHGTVWGVSGAREPLLPVSCPLGYRAPAAGSGQPGRGLGAWGFRPLPCPVSLPLLAEAVTFLPDPELSNRYQKNNSAGRAAAAPPPVVGRVGLGPQLRPPMCGRAQVPPRLPCASWHVGPRGRR